MPDKVLIHSRFPKAMLVRIGQRFDLMDAAGKLFRGEDLTRRFARGVHQFKPLADAHHHRLGEA